MKLYRIDFHVADEGMVVAWAASNAEARKVRRQLVLDYGPAYGADCINAIELPTDKAGLIRWLNINLTRDNG